MATDSPEVNDLICRSVRGSMPWPTRCEGLSGVDARGARSKATPGAPESRARVCGCKERGENGLAQEIGRRLQWAGDQQKHGPTNSGHSQSRLWPPTEEEAEDNHRRNHLELLPPPANTA